MFGMNAVVVVGVAITLLHSSGQPSTQQIWVVTCDLSSNGMMPRHQLLLLLLLLFFYGETGYVPTYLVAQFSSLKASRRCKQLEGGKKKTPIYYLPSQSPAWRFKRAMAATYFHSLVGQELGGNLLKNLIYLGR
jgi:hypothetical protein